VSVPKHLTTGRMIHRD